MFIFEEGWENRFSWIDLLWRVSVGLRVGEGELVSSIEERDSFLAKNVVE
jgi:hypothetical protein